MLRSHIDHLVVTAPTLEQGAAYVENAVGIVPQVGGEHPRMGTHNLVLRLGADVYLEVIAVNPKALPPDRPRWFELDGSLRQPRLATWVARSNSIHDACTASPVPLGHVEAMTRGQLEWSITLSEDGKLPLQGIAPALIQWRGQAHPAAAMPDMGCALIRVDAFHPEAGLGNRMLESIGFDGVLRMLPAPAGIAPHLVAYIQTPSGPRQLGGT